jgi:hypothetical protein
MANNTIRKSEFNVATDLSWTDENKSGISK